MVYISVTQENINRKFEYKDCRTHIIYGICIFINVHIDYNAVVTNQIINCIFIMNEYWNKDKKFENDYVSQDFCSLIDRIWLTSQVGKP